MSLSVLADWLLSLLFLLANAEAALPVVLVLGLAAGRRGNAEFILSASARLARFVFAFSILPPLWYFLDYLNQIAPFLRPENNVLSPLLTRAGAGWLAAILCSSCALFCLWLAVNTFAATASRLRIEDDKYALAELKIPVLIFLLAGALYFLAFWLINWPFSGLPDGLSMERAFAAIGKNAARRYFASFSAAGALGLALAVRFPFPDSASRLLGMRWMAFWAAAGYLPRLLTMCGLALGASLGNIRAPYDATFHAVGAGALLFALLCWSLILFWKKTSGFIVAGGWVFLAIYASAPTIRKLIKFLFDS